MNKKFVILITFLNILKKISTINEFPPYLIRTQDIILQKTNLFQIRGKDILLKGVKMPKNLKLEEVGLNFLKNFFKDKKYASIEVKKRIGNLDLCVVFVGKINLNQFLIQEGLGFSGHVDFEKLELKAHEEKKGFWKDEYRKFIFKEDWEEDEEFVF